MKVELKVVGGARAGQLIPVSASQFMIGRADDCHLKPRSELISRYHCAILSEDGYIAVRDLGSKNGVYVNGQRVTMEQQLQNGDRLAIGPLEFELVLTVGLKGNTKPKISSISDVVSRTIEQNALNVSTKLQESATVSPVANVVPTEPVSTSGSAVAPDSTSTPEPVSIVAQADAQEDAAAADWLLGDDDIPEETRTLQMAADSLDLPYTPQEAEKTPQEAEKKKDDGPSSSDAAANLLKNFFKGGR